MKEILKYLRQIKSLSQEEVAQRLGISRQSYIKYEKGTVIPNQETINELAKLYGVTSSFIKENKIPSLNTAQPANFAYKMKQDSGINVAEPQVQYGTSPRKVYEGIFDGESIRILNTGEKSKLKYGQRIKFYIEEESEILRRRQEAVNTIQSILAELKPCKFDDDDPYYKKALEEALNEKYGLD